MRLCFATNNKHKLAEVGAMLPVHIQLMSLEDIGCNRELPETGDTLQANALQKAQSVRADFGINCFADDTGLEVDALNGAPGVYSARYAGPDRDDRSNCAKLLKSLESKNNRKARFRTVICLVTENETHYFEGIINGTITKAPQGNNGFGYDPVFLPDGYQLTFAEMPSSQKNLISHRAEAVKELVYFLKMKS